jgi:hypothetical protein
VAVGLGDPAADAAAAGEVGAFEAADAAGDAADAARGIGEAGPGPFSSTTNSAGGTVWTSEGTVTQGDFGTIVNNAQYSGNSVNIITGAHGAEDGTMIYDGSMYADDVATFGNSPGVSVYNVSQMSDSQITALLNGPGTTIGGFCNSGVCLAPYW